MPADTLHLRGRRGGPLCGAHGTGTTSVRVTAIEHYARLRARRCWACWRELLAILTAVEGRQKA